MNFNMELVERFLSVGYWGLLMDINLHDKMKIETN